MDLSKPSSSCMTGFQPNKFLACDISGLLCFGSSSGISKKVIFEKLPVFSRTFSANSKMLNSFGFPSRNFDPLTGDLFKVHYYSFFFAISFFVLILHFLSKFKTARLLILILIPIFLFSIGFPKNISESNIAGIEEKIEKYNLCKVTNFTKQLSC